MNAEILLTQKVGTGPSILTYQIPPDLAVRAGHIVEVPLRTKKIKGVVYALSNSTTSFKTRPILGIVENAPHLEPWQLILLQWISQYYFASLSKTLKLFLPVPFIKKKKLVAVLPDMSPEYSFQSHNTLSPGQQEILNRFESTQKSVSLLHGITGSGKTEIYLRAADQRLKEGYQVLMLIPEISLTPQTLERFKIHFGQKIAVIHSQLTPHQKELEWLSIHRGEARIIIGSRSAIFAPFQKLGLIIMDEEHDDSYKQDQTPRYHTVEVAKQIARLLNIKVLMGSATPSLESYYQALQGNYELLELKERIGGKAGTALPQTHIVDLRDELKKKNFSIFSDLLRQKIAEKLAKKEQLLLFLNRRGAASSVLCRECGYIVKCRDCEVPMTYHNRVTIEDLQLKADRLICHHCGKIEKIPASCPDCQSVAIRYIGIGTQRIEEELNKNFALARNIRADRDTVKKKDAFKKVYQALKNREADILIGTQMVALGLHFPNINLVGIVLADIGLTIPNFRSNEKTFQLLTQVAGRAGREALQSDVVIQTYLPNHYAIRQAAAHDYGGFYSEEIAMREKLGYPPFTRLIKVTVSHKKSSECEKLSATIFENMKKLDSGGNTITTYPALIPKFQQKFRWNILISGKHPAQLLQRYLDHYPSMLENSAIRIDVDPLSTV